MNVMFGLMCLGFIVGMIVGIVSATTFDDSDGAGAIISLLMGFGMLVIVFLFSSSYLTFDTRNFHVKSSETEIVVFENNKNCEELSTGKFACYSKPAD